MIKRILLSRLFISLGAVLLFSYSFISYAQDARCPISPTQYKIPVSDPDPPSEAGAFPADLDEIMAYVQQNNIGSVKELLDHMPRHMRGNYSFVAETRALGQTSLNNPGLVIFGSDGRFMMNIGSIPSSPLYEVVDIAYLQDNGDWEFKSLDFRSATPVLSPNGGNNGECRECHALGGTTSSTGPMRPFWGNYLDWPGIFSDDGAGGEKFTAAQRPAMEAIHNGTLNNDRFHNLILPTGNSALNVADQQRLPLNWYTPALTVHNNALASAVLESIYKRMRRSPSYAGLREELFALNTCLRNNKITSSQANTIRDALGLASSHWSEIFTLLGMDAKHEFALHKLATEHGQVTNQDLEWNIASGALPKFLDIMILTELANENSQINNILSSYGTDYTYPMTSDCGVNWNMRQFLDHKMYAYFTVKGNARTEVYRSPDGYFDIDYSRTNQLLNLVDTQICNMFMQNVSASQTLGNPAAPGSSCVVPGCVDAGGGSSGGSSSGGSSSGGSSSGGSSSSSGGGNQLQNDVPVTGLTASTGNDVVYTIEVPNGASNLVIKIESGSGDADLYTRAGAAPTDSTYDCRPYIGGNAETCTEANPTAGTWYARVKAYQTFSGVSLTASYDGGGSSSGGSSSSSGGSSSGGSSSGGDLLTIRNSSTHGDYLAGGPGSPQDGMSLYVFDNDQGTGGSSCNGGCATTWPPLTVSSASDITGATGLNLSTISRDDGSLQVTLNTRPVYFYASDNVAGDTNGHGVGNVWWLAVTSGGSSSGGGSSGGSSSGGSSSGGSSSGGSSSSSGGGNQLQNSVPVTGLSANTGSDVVYTINVPSGASDLVIKIEGGSGDADLYTRAGAAPTDSTYDCRPYIGGNVETCTEANPVAGIWYARVKAYQTFSGVSLTASYTGGGSSSGGSSSGGSSSGGSSGGNISPLAEANGPYSGMVGHNIAFSKAGSNDADGTITSYLWNFGDGNTTTTQNPAHAYSATGTYTVTLTVTDNDGATASDTATATISEAVTPLGNGVPISGLSGAQGSDQFFFIHVHGNPPSNLNINISGGTGDADLYVKQGAKPTTSDYDCRPYVGGNSENCDFAAPQHGPYFIMLRAYNAYSGVTLSGSFDQGGSSSGGSSSGGSSSGGSSSGGGNEYGLANACDLGRPAQSNTNLLLGEAICTQSASSGQVNFKYIPTAADAGKDILFTIGHGSGIAGLTANQDFNGYATEADYNANPSSVYGSFGFDPLNQRRTYNFVIVPNVQANKDIWISLNSGSGGFSGVALKGEVIVPVDTANLPNACAGGATPISDQYVNLGEAVCGKSSQGPGFYTHFTYRPTSEHAGKSFLLEMAHGTSGNANITVNQHYPDAPTSGGTAFAHEEHLADRPDIVYMSFRPATEQRVIYPNAQANRDIFVVIPPGPNGFSTFTFRISVIN